MKLIKERLKLVISNLIAAWCRRHRSNWLSLKSAEQLLKLAVSDVARRHINSRLNVFYARLGFVRDLSLNNFLGTCWLGQACQSCKQCWRSRSKLRTLTHLGKHAINGIQRFQDHVHQGGIYAPLTLAQDVENVFSDVAAFNQLVELEKPSTTFDGMKPAKNGVEQIHVVRAAFKLYQLLGQKFKNLAGLYQEVLEDFFIGAEAHIDVLLKS